jgi:hypothetical protein
MITELLKRLRFLILRKKLTELDEELQFHLERAIAANISAGMTPVEARRQALIEFGGVERAREQCHEQRPGWWMRTVAQDVHYALRGFRRNPVFTIAVIVTLALGIGATTAVFTVVDRILFRSLPYAHDDRLVSVGTVHSLEKQEFMMGGFFFDWRDHQKPFESMAIQSTMPHACDLIENNPAQLDCLNFDAGYLPLLGISPVLGRNFLPEEVPQRTSRGHHFLRVMAGPLQPRSKYPEPPDQCRWQPGARCWSVAEGLPVSYAATFRRDFPDAAQPGGPEDRQRRLRRSDADVRAPQAWGEH